MSTRQIVNEPLEDLKTKHNFMDEDQTARDQELPKTGEAGGKVSRKRDERHPRLLRLTRFCLCQGTVHEIWPNCKKCGGMLCVIEGSGYCTFCVSLACSLAEKQILRNGDQRAKDLFGQLKLGVKDAPTIASINEVLEKALEKKNKLFEYQLHCAQRTIAYDDQGNWSVQSPWMSKERKSELQRRYEQLFNQKYCSRLKKPVMLKFNGNEIVEEKVFIDLFSSNLHSNDLSEAIADAIIPQRSAVTYISEPVDLPSGSSTARNHELRNAPRVQSDETEIETVPDEGKYLCLHQPYASLLIRGIKRFEARSWYTTHRGILWIAATKKQPTNDEVTSLENFYQLLYNRHLPRPFPTEYPVGCLLGCVEVIDCLSQEEYRSQYPEGESEAPYVLICTNPRELPLKFPVLGKQRIYKLDRQIHEAACNAIEMKFTVD